MILLEFSMSPLGKGESVGEYVAESLRIIQRSGLDYRLHAMGTIIEGEWDQVFAVAKECFEAMSQKASRVSCTMKMDYRAGASGRLESKVASVTQRLEQPPKVVERNDS